MKNPQANRDGAGDPRRGLGARGEQIALEHLGALGIRVIDTNWRRAEGEIDIIAYDGEVLTFTEVRTRRGRRGPRPEQSLTRAKQERLIKLGRLYLDEHNLGAVQWRIDFVAVEMDQRGVLVRVELIKNAVSGW